MGQITLQIPQSGLPNSTEDPKVASDLTAIQNLLNGNLDSSNLSPSAGILQSQLASGASASYGFSNVSTAQSTTSTSFTTLATSDVVNSVVLPANGLIQVWFQGTWTLPGSGTAQAAIFIGANQLKVATVGGPAVQAADRGSSGFRDQPLVSSPFGLVTTDNTSAYSGDATTGQAVGFIANGANVTYAIGGTAIAQASPVGVGGPCNIFAAAGTYNVSVQFKTSSTVTAKNRQLFVRTVLFA